MCTGTHDFIPAENVASLELIYVLDGQRIENRLYILGSAEWTESDIRELAETAETAWTDNLAPIISDQVQLVMCRAKNLSNEFGAVFEHEPTSVVTGDVTGGSMPNNVTLTTKFASGFSGRSRRGRVYTPGIPRVSVGTSAINEVTPVVAGQFSSAWGTFFENIVTLVDNATNHVVVSYCAEGEWRTSGLVTPITAYSTNATLDSQRRRLPERGQ